MIILAEIASAKKRVSRGPHTGREIQNSWGIGIDGYNLIIAKKSGSNPWQGQKFYPRFAMMEKVLKRMGMDLENVSALLQQSLFYVYGHERLNSSLTLAQLDVRFSPSKPKISIRGDSSGLIQMYIDIRKYVKGAVDDDNDDESEIKGDIIIEVPDFPGKVQPQSSFKEIDEDEDAPEVEVVSVSEKKHEPKKKQSFASLMNSVRQSVKKESITPSTGIPLKVRKRQRRRRL